MDEHATVVAECADDFPKHNRLTKCVLGGVVRRPDRWLTGEGESVVKPAFHLPEQCCHWSVGK